MNESSELAKALDILIRNPGMSGNSPATPTLLRGPGEYGHIEDNVRLREMWRSIRKRMGLVIGICAVVTALVTFYMARKPDIYQAGAEVQIDLEGASSALGGSKSNAIILSNLDDPTYFNTQLQILTKPGLLRRVTKTLDLEHNQAFLHPTQGNRTIWQSMLNLVGIKSRNQNQVNNTSPNSPLLLQPGSLQPGAAKEDLEESMRLEPYVLAIQRGLKVEPVKETRNTVRDTRLIDISFDHTDPLVAAKVVNAIADTFVLANIEKRSETNETTGDFLQKRIAELQANMRTGEEQLVNYAKDHQILSLDATQNTVVERLTGLNRQLLEAENERKMAEAAYKAALSPGAAESLANVNDKAVVSAAEIKLAELRQHRAQLLVDNTEEWPEVKEINQQILALEKQVSDVRTRATASIVSNLQTRYRETSDREQSLRTAFEKQRQDTLSQNEAAINYRIIQQEIETNKTLLDDLLQRSKENGVVLAGTPNNIHVVDHAIIPSRPVGPMRWQGIALAFVLSLAFGVGLALLLDSLDDTLRSTDDVETMLGLPALAVIPSIGAIARRRWFPKVSALQTRNGNGNGHAPAKILISSDASPLSEAYRQLRTSVLLSTAGRAPRSLLVTSSVPGEGKTTTTVNLALTLAQTGAKVLIIDADMRRPRVHQIFDIENKLGLSGVLSGSMTEADVSKLIDKNAVSNVNVLTSGPIPPNPAELLGSEQMRKLIRACEARFTHVVIDSPPVASFTDSVLLSSMVDSVLLVVHGGKSSRGIVRRARQLLHDVGAKICGVVLNNVNVRKHSDYYYQYYQQSYYHSDPDAES
jgi:polysaccharide biosynthesis transport protein